MFTAHRIDSNFNPFLLIIFFALLHFCFASFLLYIALHCLVMSCLASLLHCLTFALSLFCIASLLPCRSFEIPWFDTLYLVFCRFAFGTLIRYSANFDALEHVAIEKNIIKIATELEVYVIVYKISDKKQMILASYKHRNQHTQDHVESCCF